ncbi:MAG: type II toxin-antitoxin system VapC family toxin [Bryobacteraceae bacterium]
MTSTADFGFTPVPFLIDSNVLIDVSRGDSGAIKYVDNLAEPWALSQVSALELIVGARNQRDLATIDQFLSHYPVVPLNEHIGTRAYQLLKSYAKSDGLHVFDAMIAATAIDRALTLVTLNRKHYRMIEGLTLEIPDY